VPTAGQDEPLPVIRIAALSESHGLAPVSKKLHQPAHPPHESNCMTYRSADFPAIRADFEVLLEKTPARRDPLLTLKVNVDDGTSFLLPMCPVAARDLAHTMLQALLSAAPQVFGQ
jgi:hypothetical protein